MRSNLMFTCIGGCAIAATMSTSPPRAGATQPVQLFPAPPPTSQPIQRSNASGNRPARPHPLGDVAALVEGDVSKIWNTYDSRLGPRMFVELANVVTHAGKPLATLTFSQLGGPLPDGRFTEGLELPKFTIGARYILFLGTQATVYTPIWARLAFRVEQVGAKAAVLGPDGYPVLHFGADGVQFGHTAWLEKPDDSKRATGEKFRQDVAIADAESANAMGSGDFVATAKQAMASVGSPLTSTVTLDPGPDVQWDDSPTTPQ